MELIKNNSKLIELISFISLSNNDDLKFRNNFPSNYNNQRNLDQLLKIFSDFKKTLHVNQAPFTITLTNINGIFTFCHCIVCPTSQTITCILSHLSCHKYFFELLSVINFLLIDKQFNDIEDIVKTVLNPKNETELLPKKYITPSGINIGLKESKSLSTFYSKMFYDENGFIKELCQKVNVNILLSAYEAVMFEKKILLSSKSIYKLMCFVYGIADFIRPFEWQGRLVPIIYKDSYNSIGFQNSFIIGISQSEFEKLTTPDYPDLLIVDIDNSHIIKNIVWDGIRLPVKIKEHLKTDLINFFNKNIDWSFFNEEKFIDIFISTTALFLGKTLNNVVDVKKIKKPFGADFKKEISVIKRTKYFQESLRLNDNLKKEAEEYKNAKTSTTSLKKPSFFQKRKASILDKFE